MTKHTAEQEITVRLIKEYGLYGGENQAIRDQAKAENPMLIPVWDYPAEDNPEVVSIIWRLVETVLGGRGG